MEHNVGPMQQSSVQHLASQMNQLQMSGSQYITSPVHSSFSQASWQMMHQHGQPQHPHAHYMSLEVRNLQSDSDLTFKCVDETLACDHSSESYWTALFHIALLMTGSGSFYISGPFNCRRRGSPWAAHVATSNRATTASCWPHSVFGGPQNGKLCIAVSTKVSSAFVFHFTQDKSSADK